MRKLAAFVFEKTNATAVAFWLIVFFAFVIRIYKLDTPSLWGDELFAPIMASKPVSYLVRWVFLEDVHPPLFYFFLKPILWVSRSDFALRLPAVCFGVASLYLFFNMLKNRISERCALLALSVLAVSAAHIYLSRVARFYSFTIFLTLCCLYALERFDRTRERKYLRYGSASMAGMLLAEYTSLMPISALFLLFFWTIAKGRENKPLMKRFFRDCLLFFPLPLFFLAITSYQRRGFSQASTLAVSAGNYLRSLRWVLEGGMRPSLNATLAGALLLLALLGAVRLYRSDKRTFAAALALPVCSFSLILLLRPGYSLAFWHLFYLLPPLALLLGAGLSALLPCNAQKAAAVMIAVLGAAAYLGPMSDMFYDPLSYLSDVRRQARAAASEIAPGGAVLIDYNEFDNLNWYLDQFALDNRVANQTPDVGGTSVTLNAFVNAKGGIGHIGALADDAAIPLRVTGDRMLGISRLLTLEIPRAPAPAFENGGAPVVLGAAPWDFYAHASGIRDVMIRPYWGMGVIPTKNQEWTGFRYTLENRLQSPRLLLQGTLAYQLSGAGNAFAAYYQFDDEPEKELFIEKGPVAGNAGGPDDPRVERPVFLLRDAPFRRVTLRVGMFCDYRTPHYPTSNLVTVAFNKLTLQARTYGADLMDEAALDPRFRLENIAGVAKDDKGAWRWALGPVSRIAFSLNEPQKARLRLALNSPFAGQSCVITVNGRKIGELSNIPRHGWMEERVAADIAFEADKGENVVELAFGKTNHVNDSFSETDATPYAAAIVGLAISKAGEDSPLAP